MEDNHQQDIEFLEELKEMTMHELSSYQLYFASQFNACEVWKQIAVDREIARRKGSK